MFSVYFFVFFVWKILHFPKNSVNIFVNFCAVKYENTIIFAVEKNTEIFYGTFHANISENICAA